VLFAGSSEAGPAGDVFACGSPRSITGLRWNHFPLLGHEFVAATVKTAGHGSKAPLESGRRLEGRLLLLRKLPSFFRWYNRALSDLPAPRGLSRHCGISKREYTTTTSYTKTWKELNRADRAITAIGGPWCAGPLWNPTRSNSLKICWALPNVTVSAPRTSLRPAYESQAATASARVDHGAYRFEDPEFQAWVTTRRTVD